MQLSTEQQQQLSHLLKTELEVGQQLLVILEEEHQALSNRDADRITALSQTKLNQLQTFEKQMSQRSHFFKGLGIPQEQGAIDKLLQAPRCHPTVIKQWQELRQLADSLQLQNEINGGIVTLSQRHISMALDVLTGQNNSTPTYGRSGKTTTGNSSGRLAKA